MSICASLLFGVREGESPNRKFSIFIPRRPFLQNVFKYLWLSFLSLYTHICMNKNLNLAALNSLAFNNRLLSELGSPLSLISPRRYIQKAIKGTQKKKRKICQKNNPTVATAVLDYVDFRLPRFQTLSCVYLHSLRCFHKAHQQQHARSNSNNLKNMYVYVLPR